MRTTLNIKNFRVFDENGASFELNPITILTGSNSSGKSSVVKAIFLLNGFLEQVKKSIDKGESIKLDKVKLDFTTYPNNLLGRFDKVVHDGTESRSITIEYTSYSLMLSKEVTVQLVFSADENDELNNAFLESIKMSTEDGTFFSSGMDEHSYCNLNIIKEDYVTFLLTEFAVHKFSLVEYNNEFRGSMKKEEYEETVHGIFQYLKDVKKHRRDDIFRYVRTVNRKKSLIEEFEAEPKVVEALQGKKSIFSIPVVERLANIAKSEVESFVESEIIPENNKGLSLASHKVIECFIKSSFDNFADFFADFENRFFNEVQVSDRVHMLTAGELTLRQNYLNLNPYSHGRYKTVILFDDDQIIEQEVDEAKEEANRQKEIDEWKNRPLTFEIIYEVVMAWNKAYSSDHNDAYFYIGDLLRYVALHKSHMLLTKFAEYLVQEVLCPDWSGNLSYISSARASVSRLYSLTDNDDFSLLLQNYFEKKRLFEERNKNSYYRSIRKYHANKFINRWLQKFEIGKAISLKIDKEGFGVQIRLHKSKKDKGRLLADEGYGITQLISILLQIETAILSAQGEKVNKLFRVESIDGYNTEEFHYEINTIAIEEPEIHLHPKFQSLLTDMFLEAYEKYNIHFIIETHSEYLIRKAQVFVARSKYKNEEAMKKNNPFMVYYVPKEEKPYEITFRTDGRFDNEFGKGFFDEAADLAFEIL